MKTRWRPLLLGLGFALLLATAFLVGHREEPVYQGKPLSYWVTKLGSDELHGAPKDAVAAIRAIGPKAVPFLLEWMPHDHPHSHQVRQWRGPVWISRAWLWCVEQVQGLAKQKERKIPDSLCVEFAWWALGTEGKSAIPVLARVINKPLGTRDDYSAWTHSAKAISFLGPDAIFPMLNAATNMQGRDEVWELIHNFGNLGTNGAPAVPALLQWTNHPYYFVRAGVASALGGIGKRPDLAVPVLLAALQDSNSMVRRDAAQALGAFADDSEAVLPALVETLNGTNSEARGGALSGLGRIRSRPETVIPLITPFLSDTSVARSAAYALRDLGSRAGLLALLRTTNEVPGLSGIGDIVYGAVEMISSEEEEKRRQDTIKKLDGIYAKGEAPQLRDLVIEGKPVSQLLSNQAIPDPPLRLDQMLTLRQVSTAAEEDAAIFEVTVSYDAVAKLGTLRLLCDADPNETPGEEAIVQELDRATNGNCLLVWNTSYDPPGRHFLQAELAIYRRHSDSQQGNYIEQVIPLRGPLFSFLSTNAVQCFPHADTYTDHGAFFRVKLAQPVGSFSVSSGVIVGRD